MIARPISLCLHALVSLPSANWESNADFNAVFTKSFPPTVEAELPEEMIKRFFIFSDMQFDE